MGGPRRSPHPSFWSSLLLKLGLNTCLAYASAVTGILASLCSQNAVAQTSNESDASWAGMRTSLLPMRPPVSQDAQWIVRSVFSAFAATDAVPVLDASGNWKHYAPTGGRNNGLEQAYFDLSATRSGWEVATTLRSDILISASRGAVDLVHAYKQKLKLPDGSNLGVATRETGLTLAGLRVAHTWSFELAPRQSLQVTGALTALSVQSVQRWDVRGRAGHTKADGYSLDARVLRQNSQKRFSGYGMNHPDGFGYTADLGVMWTPSDDSFVNISAVDLFSRASFSGVATQNAKASTSTKSTDAQGYVEYKPLITGRYSSQRVALRLNPKLGISGGVRVDWLGSGTQLGARLEHVANINIPSLWTVMPLTDGFSLQLEAETRFHSFGIGLLHRYGSLMLRTRSLNLGRSESLGVQAAVNVSF